MPETFTPKLALIKPVRDTSTVIDVDRLNLNSDKIDEVQGVLHVANDVIPPDSLLFDGRMVREKTSGKVWVARAQTNGTYARKWMQYPFFIIAFTQSIINGSGPGWQLGDFKTWHSGANSSQADIVSEVIDGGPKSAIKMPVEGFYTGHIHLLFKNQAASSGLMGGSININGERSGGPGTPWFTEINSETYKEHRGFGGHDTLNVPVSWYFNKGDLLRFVWWNETGVTQDIYASCMMGLTQPGRQILPTDAL